MKKNKIGTLFLISLLAIAGIGISYAGFSDVIRVYGTVDTATVQLTLENYSGTIVWKIWDCPTTTPPVYPGLTLDIANEVAIYRGFNLTASYYAIEDLIAGWGCSYEEESSAGAFPGIDHDVNMWWLNIFPCINFTADVIIHYTGTIPAHVTVGDIVWATGTTENGTVLFNFGNYTTFHAYEYTKNNVTGAWEKGAEIGFPVQIHYCEYVDIEVTIHLPQDNTLQGLHGECSFNINAIQWNDLCKSNGNGEETAWGGDFKGSGAQWWYYFIDETNPTQTIWASKDATPIGTVHVGLPPDADGNVWITLTLFDDWELQDVPNPVKIQGFHELPAVAPTPGLFTTYKGDQLVIEVYAGDPTYIYWVFHLDIQQTL